jgi:hypothetical protein
MVNQETYEKSNAKANGVKVLKISRGSAPPLDKDTGRIIFSPTNKVAIGR